MNKMGETNMEQITRTMVLNRTTKGAARFAEVLGEGEPEVVGNIYLRKWALGDLLSGLPAEQKVIEDSDVTIQVIVGPAV